MRTGYNEVLEQWIQAVVALSMILGTLALAFVLLIRGESLSAIPNWITLALGAVIAWYFGGRTFKLGVSSGTNGVLDAAAKVSAAQTNAAAVQIVADQAHANAQEEK